jgi:hypothetical protein
MYSKNDRIRLRAKENESVRACLYSSISLHVKILATRGQTKARAQPPESNVNLSYQRA